MKTKYLAYFILIILSAHINLQTMEQKDEQKKIVLLQKQLEECNQSKKQLKNKCGKLKKEHENVKLKLNHESHQKEAWQRGYDALFQENYQLKEALKRCMQSSQKKPSESDSLKE